MRPFDHGQKPRRLFGESESEPKVRTDALKMLDSLGINPDCGLHKLTTEELTQLVECVLRAMDEASASVH
jgi:hypothetical protein